MKKWMTIFLALTLIASLLAGFAVTAQAAGEEEKEEKTDAEAAETEEAADEAAEDEEAADEEDYEGLDRIGNDAEETEKTYKIKLTNATGSDIMGMNIQKTTDDSWVWSDELLADDDTFEDGETALFCYTPDEEDEDETWLMDYNVQIVFTDWTVGYLHNVLLSDIDKEAELQRAANSLPYLVYTSLASEEEVNTAEREQAAFEGELAAGVWDSVIGGGSSSSSGSSSGGSSSSGGGSYSTGSNTEGCQNGALFN